MRLVIVTGMSGGGKRTAMKMLEDVGFYCVDNLPVSFIEKFVGLVSAPNNEISKVALGLDARANQSFEEVERILENLRKDGCKFEILFMDASDQVLLKRYKETRRVHPLAPADRVEDGIARDCSFKSICSFSCRFASDQFNVFVIDKVIKTSDCI